MRSAAASRTAVVALVAAALVVLGLLAVFAVSLANTQAKSRRDVEARVHERAVLAAALLDSLFQTAGQQIPLDQARYGGRSVTSAVLDRYRQQDAYLVLLDRSGRVLASSSGFTRQARADLAASAALALVRSGHPYGLGNVLPYGRTGVINFAVAFPTAYGGRILLTGFAPSALAPFLTGELRKIPGVKGAHNYLIDANDTVLASNNPAKPAGYRFRSPGQRAALSRRSGDRHGHYYEQYRLANSTWRVVLAAPDGPLFASISGLRKWLPWLIFLAFALVAAAALALGSRVLRSAERELRYANARLAHDALHDPLTGLANRVLFMNRLEQILRRATRERTVGCTVMFLDTDRFKLVNDSLSHTVGDQLLIAMAERLAEVVRPGDTVARLGGDEFTLLLENVVSEGEATMIAERVHSVLSEPFKLGPHELVVAVSIGIALSSPQLTAADVLRNADIAMYHAKRRSSGTYAVFDQSMHARVADRLGRERELRHAVEHSLIAVHYQPIVDLSTGRISALEALARWPNGNQQVSPAEFIPIAEETGLIGALGQHVLRTALGTFAGWRRAGLISDDVRISVNISPRQLDDPTLPEQILAAIADAQLRPDTLCLEITESTLMQQPERMRRIGSELCAQGVGLHLDDFGTGYASLEALLQFPLDALKIDRSLVTSLIGHNDGNDTIIRSTIGLAHGLGLHVVAEGIEHPTELNHLRALRCDYGQGYHFSGPLDAHATRALLATWTPAQLAATT
jgi:diguanylate cyclase (GGDEF)-like protein